MSDAPPYTEILRGLSPERFAEVLGASARKSRETYFARHGIKAPKGPGFVKPGAKNVARAKALREVLQEQNDDQLAEEVLRVYLLGKRPMLAAALDHLGIENDDGLTESEDVDKFTTLKGKALEQMIAELEKVAPREDIELYLRYMGTDL